MFCQCGRSVLLAEEDADLKAIDDLNNQSKSSSGVIADLLKTRVEQLKAEVSAERSFKTGLQRSRREIIDLIRTSLTTVTPQALMNLSDEQLLDLMLQGGLGQSIDQFIGDQDDIAESIKSMMSVIEPSFNFNSINNSVDAISLQNANAVFDEIIIPSYRKNIRQALRDIDFGATVDTALSNLQLKMKQSEGSMLTEVRTKISQYGRSVSAIAGVGAGLKNYLYTGPRDGVTRKFCSELVNKVVSESQMKRFTDDFVDEL